jgi:hypothetical protein
MHRAIRFALLAGLLASAQAFSATLQNGDFGGGSLTGWTVTGNASSENLLAGPAPSGNPYQAFIGNVGVSVYALGSGAAVSVATLQSALGLAPGAFDTLKIAGDTGGVTFGSAIQQSFTANAGDHLHFNWNFLSDDPGNHAGNDFAFMLLDGNLQRIANTFTPSGVTPTVFTGETGYQGFSALISSTGTHTLAFGVVDVDLPDHALGASAVLIDNVTITAVPEPGSVVLMFAGLAMLAGVVRTRSRGA